MKLIIHLLKKTSLTLGLVFLTILILILFSITPLELPDWKSTHVTQIYFADNISTAHQRLIDDFNRKYAGEIEVVPMNLPFSKFSTNERKEILARVLRGQSSRIDLFAIDLIWGPRFAKWCQPLDAYFSAADRAQILSYSLESCYFENQLVAIPLYIDVGLMYYRRDLLQPLSDFPAIEARLQASITWEEFIELHRRFPNAANPFYLFAADNYEGLICSFWETIARQSHQIFSGEVIEFQVPAARKGLRLLVDLVNYYHLTPSIVTKFDEYQCYIYAMKQNAIFLRGWPGMLRHFREDTTKFKFLKIAALPHFEGTQAGSVFGGWNIMISKFSTHKDAAAKFLRFILEKENQIKMYQNGGYLPTNAQVYQDSTFCTQQPELKFYRQLLDHGIHRPYLVDYTRISDILSNYLHRAIQQEISVEEALQAATRDINTRTPLAK